MCCLGSRSNCDSQMVQRDYQIAYNFLVFTSVFKIYVRRSERQICVTLPRYSLIDEMLVIWAYSSPFENNRRRKQKSLWHFRICSCIRFIMEWLHCKSWALHNLLHDSMSQKVFGNASLFLYNKSKLSCVIFPQKSHYFFMFTSHIHLKVQCSGEHRNFSSLFSTGEISSKISSHVEFLVKTL